MEIRTPLHWTEAEAITDQMPLLDTWLAGHMEAQPLKGCAALMLQHQLGNHVAQTRALLALGLRPQDLHWIDIPYTARKPVQAAIRAMGMPAENFVPGGYRVLDPYAPYMRKRVAGFLERLAADPPEHLLVLDDGSYFLDALREHPVALRRVSIVEQTTRGIIKIEEDKKLAALAERFPLVNVARSRPKRELEPPFIGVAVFKALERKLLGTLRAGKRDHALVLGYGDIGKQVAHFAARWLGFAPHQVHVFDTDEDRMKAVRAAGFSEWDRTDGTRFRLVLGCSGRASFTEQDYIHLEDGAILVSASSGTVELSREQFIEWADECPHDEVWIEREGLDEANIHSDLVFHFVDRDATFINAGFPVNFDGRVNCVPDRYIQPTTTMMCAAAVQAVAETRKGLVPLDPTFSTNLIDGFRHLLGEEVHWLG
ncbi:MAG: hypothetical protein IPM46_02760 [Flavobacteriales bacterium]|nr:hypothetical protein [Flavobacteriales bacterium]